MPGYAVPLGQSYNESFSIFKYLQDNQWLDRFTRSVRLEVVSYTAHLNLLTMMKVQFDLNNPVGIIPQYQINTVKMYRSVHGFSVFVLLLEILYCLYSLYFACFVFKSMIRKRRSYFKNVWSLLDISVVLASLCIMITYILYYVTTANAVVEYQTTYNTKQFLGVVSIEHVLTFFLALLVTLASLKFLNMLRFNPIIFRFLAVVNRAKSQLLGLGLLIVIVYTQCAITFCKLAGPHTYRYRSPPVAFISLFLATIGDFDIVALKEVHPIWGPFLLVSFLFIAEYIVVNLLVAALCSTIDIVFKEDLYPEEAYLLQSLINKVLVLLSMKNSEEDEAKKTSENNEGINDSEKNEGINDSKKYEDIKNSEENVDEGKSQNYV